LFQLTATNLLFAARLNCTAKSYPLLFSLKEQNLEFKFGWELLFIRLIVLDFRYGFLIVIRSASHFVSIRQR